METKKSTWGGARAGAGRKRQGEPLTATVTLCMSETMRAELKAFQKEHQISAREMLRFALTISPQRRPANAQREAGETRGQGIC